MDLQEGYLYHIYNQGNNRQRIFFKHINYEFFKKKIIEYVKPYADVFAYCLMPNHFHLMVRVIKLQLPVQTIYQNKTSNKMRSINDSIGIMVRSYTNAINKQEDRSGSLFKNPTKSECLNCPKNLSPAFNAQNRTKGFIDSKVNYPQTVFDYIHENPVKSNLVRRAIFYEFSSAKNYFFNEDDALIQTEIAKKFGIVF